MTEAPVAQSPGPRQGQYHVLKRPTSGWIIGRVVGALALLGVIWAIDSQFPWFHDVMVIVLSTLGGLALLYASWNSIKVRERLCLLALAADRDDDAELAEALEEIGRVENRKVLNTLETEWKMNIHGVILLLMAVCAYGMKYI